MDDQTKSRIYALRAGNFCEAGSLYPSIPCPPGFDFEGMNPHLIKRIGKIGSFLGAVNRIKKYEPDIYGTNSAGLRKIFSLYVGHADYLKESLSHLTAKDNLSPERPPSEGDTQLARSIWMSRRLERLLKDTAGNYSGKMLCSIGEIIYGGMLTHGIGKFAWRARDLYFNRPEEIEPYFQIVANTLEKEVSHRELITKFGLDLIQRLLDDPKFDICDESILSGEEREKYEQAIEVANDFSDGFYISEIGELNTPLPDKEAFLDEQRMMDAALSGLEPIIQRFHEHVLDYR